MKKSYVMATYSRMPLSFTHGEGVFLVGEDERRYIDFMTGIGVNILGHAHPKLCNVMNKQASKLWHVSNQFIIPEQERLAERLCKHSFADRVFFANTGAEAIECALKLSRRYFDVIGRSERWRTIVFDGAFHGRTLATIVAGGGEKYLHGFEPHADGFDRASFNDLESVRKAICAETAAIMVEPVQGEGGVRAATDEFLIGLRRIADEHGILLIFDEVQSGNGRTGQLYCHQWTNIAPDILATAKGLGAGFPVAACLSTEEVARGFEMGSHGTTFGGNPLAMAISNTVIEMICEPGFLEGVRETADYLREGLVTIAKSYPDVLGAELRGRGMMIGIPGVLPNTVIIEALRAEGLLAVTARENMIRLLPPLIINKSHVDYSLELITGACRKLTGC